VSASTSFDITFAVLGNQRHVFVSNSGLAFNLHTFQRTVQEPASRYDKPLGIIRTVLLNNDEIRALRQLLDYLVFRCWCFALFVLHYLCVALKACWCTQSGAAPFGGAALRHAGALGVLVLFRSAFQNVQCFLV